MQYLAIVKHLELSHWLIIAGAASFLLGDFGVVMCRGPKKGSAMKLLSEYLEHALQFERLAKEEIDV
jgi:hypothetical protein